MAGYDESGGGKRRRIDKADADDSDDPKCAEGESAAAATAAAAAVGPEASSGRAATMSSTRVPVSGPCTVAAIAKKVSADASRPFHVATASASVGGACIICLDNDPVPIQSGCACRQRGDAGLAHVECRAEAAVHRVASSKKLERRGNAGRAGRTSPRPCNWGWQRRGGRVHSVCPKRTVFG
jgi:hypothetical protein